ncbi:hypothetical protein L873DRAFT_1787381 [Choiromyces venosus 120613-1]|uniref:Uncharacterized protein n=1 Tax=Choiromyces venosus 120613-1 TaxID=1336337 RepID=A0A3N4JXI3_9PEZI|nr:hypothetical protein L873DRAFT_1787381 [Choiromyces venosus 120613-1]
MSQFQSSAAHSIWTTAETEAMIKWLEEPENLRKTKKGSGITKKQVVKEIAAKIPTKPEVKVGYKYDNLLKSYREAVKMNNQSGWGLSAEDLSEGKRTLRGIFGNHPNIRPPAQYDSGLSPNEVALAVDRLLGVMDRLTAEDENEWEEIEDNSERSIVVEGSKGNERDGLVEGDNEWECITQRAKVGGEESQRELEGGTSSAIRTGEKHSFPQRLEDDEDDEVGCGGGRNTRKKRQGGGGAALVDAVTVLASVKTEGENKKFEFLNHHLQQQGELRREELKLEQERLALDKEKAKAEQQKTELLMLQLRASMGVSHRQSTGIGLDTEVLGDS